MSEQVSVEVRVGDGRWPSSERRSTTGGSDCATKQRCSSGHGTRAWSSRLTSTMATRPPRCRPHGSAAAASAPRRCHREARRRRCDARDDHRRLNHRRAPADHVRSCAARRARASGARRVRRHVDSPVECDTADDVAAIGAAIEARLPSDLAALAKVRTSPADRQVVERLRAVLARARAPEPSRRPSARALSGLLAEIVVSRWVVGRSGSRDRRQLTALPRPRPTHSPLPTPRSRRTRPAPAAWPNSGMGDPVGARGHPDRRLRRSCRARRAEHAASSPALARRPAARHDRDERGHRRIEQHQLTAGVADIGALPSARVLAGERRDVDGDGCPEAVRIDGAQVVVDGARYDVGAPGDAVAVADWDCDGTDTPAVVRPSTGDVFVFDAWATAEAPMPGRLLDRVPGRDRARDTQRHVRRGAGRRRRRRALSRGARWGG